MEVKRRHANDKIEFVVVLYTPTRHSKPEVIVDHIYTTTRHSKLGSLRRVHLIPVLVRKIFPCLYGIFSKSWLITYLVLRHKSSSFHTNVGILSWPERVFREDDYNLLVYCGVVYMIDDDDENIWFNGRRPKIFIDFK